MEALVASRQKKAKARNNDCAIMLVAETPVITPAAPKRLLVSSPKGGVGKTGFSRNLAVAAALDGLSVGTVDLDKQRSLSKWWSRRPDQAITIAHYGAELNDADQVLSQVTGHDIVIIDTPTAVEEYPEQVKYLILGADFILVPTQPSIDDTESVIEWMRYIRRFDRPAAFVLNKVRRSTNTFLEAKLHLNSAGRLCPIEVPLAEDMITAAKAGLGIMEIRKGAGSLEMDGVWRFIRAEMGI